MINLFSLLAKASIAFLMFLLVLLVWNLSEPLTDCFLQAEDGSTVPCSYYSTTQE